MMIMGLEPAANKRARSSAGDCPKTVAQTTTAGRPAVAYASEPASRRSAPPKIFGGKIPVEQLVDYSIDVVGAPVLVIEVIGVLPHVDRQQRRLALGERNLGVAGLDDLELAALLHQPPPPGTELRNGIGGEVLAEIVVAAEIGVDHRGDTARRLATAAGPEALPVERVVPGLGGIVEQP